MHENWGIKPFICPRGNFLVFVNPTKYSLKFTVCFIMHLSIDIFFNFFPLSEAELWRL